MKSHASLDKAHLEVKGNTLYYILVRFGRATMWPEAPGTERVVQDGTSEL